MADLPTNLKDDILDSSVNTRRKYRMIENEDGTYSFEDATEYSQVGDEYGAGLINETNKQVNAKVEKTVVVRDLETIGAITEEGFIPDALALKDVNDSLVRPFIDYSNVIYSDAHAKNNLAYTATEDCIVLGTISITSTTDKYIYVNDSEIGRVGLATVPIHIPLKKGDVLTCETGSNGYYSICVFKYL